MKGEVKTSRRWLMKKPWSSRNFPAVSQTTEHDVAPPIGFCSYYSPNPILVLGENTELRELALCLHRNLREPHSLRTTTKVGDKLWVLLTQKTYGKKNGSSKKKMKRNLTKMMKITEKRLQYHKYFSFSFRMSSSSCASTLLILLRKW